MKQINEIDLEFIKNTILVKGKDFDYYLNNRLTMVSENVLNNVQYCIEQCALNNVEGDFVETGVWKGGCVILAYNTYKKLNQNKKVYCFDSFEGLPAPNPEMYPVDAGDIHHTLRELSVSLEEVKKNFEIFSPLDENVIFVKGWFKDTIPYNNIEKISVLRLDGDMYESTILALDYLYPKLSVGGFCIIDDYIHIGARTAVDDYRAKYDITDPVLLADPAPGAYPVSYWIKSK